MDEVAEAAVHSKEKIMVVLELTLCLRVSRFVLVEGCSALWPCLFS